MNTSDNVLMYALIQDGTRQARVSAAVNADALNFERLENSGASENALVQR